MANLRTFRHTSNVHLVVPGPTEALVGPFGMGKAGIVYITFSILSLLVVQPAQAHLRVAHSAHSRSMGDDYITVLPSAVMVILHAL